MGDKKCQKTEAKQQLLERIASALERLAPAAHLCSGFVGARSFHLACKSARA